MHDCKNALHHAIREGESLVKIALVNEKGGVAKTASVLRLAAAAVRQGSTVTVWDADPQGTATSWYDRLSDEGMEHEFALEPISPRTLTRKTAVDTDHIILDTPPRDKEILPLAFDWADVVIVPTTPGTSDLERTLLTMSKAGETAALILVVKYDKRKNLHLEMVRELRMSDYPMFDTLIPDRVEIVRDEDRLISANLHGYDRVYKELIELNEQLTAEKSA